MDNKDHEQYEIQIKSNNPLLKNSDCELEDVIKMITKMAFETEEKELNKVLVKKAIEKLLLYPVYGHYFFIIDKNANKFCGMNLVTFEHNINFNSTILWIQSVYVHEDYRMKGLFRRLLYKNEDFVLENSEFKKTVKLYMDKDNQKAEKVYFKVGFKVCKEVLYELDYHFDDISELKQNEKESNKFTNEKFNIKILGENLDNIIEDINGGIFPKNFYEFVVDVNANENQEVKDLFCSMRSDSGVYFESLINLNKINMNEEKQNILKVVKNRNLGVVLLITNQENNKVYGFVYVFYEISDWRNSYFWWLYDIYVRPEFNEIVKTNIKEIVLKIAKINYDLSGCGVRAIVNENSESLIEKTILEKSNYIIYEKEL